jgi:hypothetical protein
MKEVVEAELVPEQPSEAVSIRIARLRAMLLTQDGAAGVARGRAVLRIRNGFVPR